MISLGSDDGQGARIAAGNRAALGGFVRATTSELFTTLGVAVAEAGPFDPRRVEWADPVSVVGAAGESVAFTVIVSAPWPLMARLIPVDDHRPEALADWSRELTNMIMGGMKRALIGHGLDLHISLPVSVVSVDARVVTSTQAPIGERFECHGQPFLVALDWLLAPGVDLSIPCGGHVADCDTFVCF